MNTKGFTAEQKEALVDLLLLGMYADGHLATAEDARVKSLVDSFGLPTDYARTQFIDAAFGRVNRHHTTDDRTKAVLELAVRFTNSDQKQQAREAIAEMLASDERVTPQESDFLEKIQRALS